MEQEPDLGQIKFRNISLFIEWVLQSGLSPLDYELVEEKRADGITLWYFKKRYESEEIQTFETIEF